MKQKLLQKITATNENIRTKARNLQQALNYAAVAASKVKESCAEDGNMRVSKGTYQSIVEEAEKKFSLDEGSIKVATVVNRLRTGRRLVAAGRGNVSPLVAVEAHFLEVILELATMRQPVTASGALNIINSMIASSNLQEEVILWKKTHGIRGENEGKLGNHYWVNFKKRHPEINSKKAVRFDSKRDDWCTYENFEKMYNGVYKAMVDARVAIELEEEVFVKVDGTITENEEESYGRKTKFLLTQPKYCLYVDEVGCNTSQKSDGNVGGQKFVVGANQRALIRVSHQDCHFTVLGFTNALGEAVCCVIILAGSEVRAKDVMGLQLWVLKQMGNVTTILEEDLHGPDEYYPYGPTCHTNGKVAETR